MPLADTVSRYGSLTKILHWLTALLILAAIPLGLAAKNAGFSTGEDLAQKAWLFSLHKTVGVSAFLVALLRILWAISQKRPGLLKPEHRLEAFAAHLVHWLLYGAMVFVPLTGWIHHAATEGFAPILWPFGQSLPFIPKNEQIAEITAVLHFLGVVVLVLSILAHIGGALKHAVIDRDQTLQRMLPGRGSAPIPPAQDHSILPPMIAALLFSVIVLVGINAPQAPKPAQTAKASAPVLSETTASASNWQVDTGTISISVHQFGSDVEGRFADWTAEILFDETATDGNHGQVEARIAIASLTLGSVTNEALGPDYLNAETFPVANYSADILSVDEGYIARGTFSLRGTEQPLDLPFTLEITDNTATMAGGFTLDRRDFNIGATIADEATLGFSVKVSVMLTATRLP